MKYIKLFFLTLLFLKSSFSLLCINSNFDQIFPNSPRSFQIQPLKESCFKYKLPENKSSISLIFSVVNSYTSEVLIYKAKNLIMMNDNKYINYEEKYNIMENSFKEIDVKNYYDYVYIIIRDSKNYFFYDNIIIYDAELPINLEPNEPINIKHFMQNNKYIFNFSSNKNLQIIYSTKIQSQKLLSIEYDNNTIIEKQLDINDSIINIKNEKEKNALLKIIVENININNNKNNYEEEFGIIIYEKNSECIEIKENNLIKINYIKNNLVQNFYFFCDISKYKKSSSINIKLDYNNKINKYINIISDIKYSFTSLKPENFINLFPSENNIEFSYDINSDENIKLFFNGEEKNYYYKYLIIKLEIKDFGIYYSPRYFTISLSKQLEEINLENIPEYHTEIININSTMDVPCYYKINLDRNYHYVFSSQIQDYLTLIKGDLLLIDSSINKNYINNQNDIIIISDTSVLTLQISNIELYNEKIYIEKIKSEDITIIENERSNEILKISMSEEYCKNNKKKYFIGSYDKDKYGDKGILMNKYWKNEEGAEIELYFKNNLDIDNTSIFPSSNIYKKLPFTSFILDTNIDLFSLSCIKPGNILIKPLMKSFKEKTHIIGQNSINLISLNSKEEILQLTSPLILEKNCDKFLYLSIQTIQENNDVQIKPDINGLFKEGIIKENKIICEKIDIDKYKSDELAIRIISDGMADIEVIEVIHYDFSEYYEIKDDKKNKINKNNFVKFINKDCQKIKVNIDGLNQVHIYYSLIKLAINDTNYIPLVYNFKNDYVQKTISKNEIIELDNKYYNKNDNIKEYIAFIFSIKDFNIKYEYDVQIQEMINNNTNIEEKKSWITILIIVIVIIIVLVGIIIYFRKKSKEQIINIESIGNNQSLYPNKKYILNDILNSNND